MRANVDRTERMRFLIEEREMAPWRVRLLEAIAGYENVALRTPPEADPLIARMLEAWERTREGGVTRTTCPDIHVAATRVLDRLRRMEGETLVLPGPHPQVGVLRLDRPPSAALLEVLITWNGQGCLILDEATDEVLLVDVLDEAEQGRVELQWTAAHPTEESTS